MSGDGGLDELRFILAAREQVQFVDVSPKQLVSVAASLVPFLEHDDANRALMGSNMQRQGVPLLVTEAPLVATGLEGRVAQDSRAVIVSEDAGKVASVTGSQIIITKDGKIPEGKKKLKHAPEDGVWIYPVRKFMRSNAATCVNQQPLVAKGDTIIDGGNSNFHDTIRRHEKLAGHGIHFIDAGTSGGVWGLENGYCMMVGGDVAPVKVMEPIFLTLAPKDGYMHCGASGAGHYVKMVHNGIEYGLMQAYAEGFEILAKSRYKVDLAQVSDLWMQGSVVRSWLLELAGRAFRAEGNELKSIKGWVADSGEGRWTVQEAIDLDVPAPLITLSLLTRFRSRQEDSYSAKVLAALRNQFGGHAVKPE